MATTSAQSNTEPSISAGLSEKTPQLATRAIFESSWRGKKPKERLASGYESEHKDDPSAPRVEEIQHSVDTESVRSCRAGIQELSEQSRFSGGHQHGWIVTTKFLEQRRNFMQ